MEALIILGVIALIAYIYGKMNRNREASLLTYDKREYNNEKFRETRRLRGVSVDDKSKQFKLESAPRKTFKYEDIIKYELNENGQQITSGGLSIGKALVGGALIGGTGMLLGGLTGNRKSKDTVTDMTISLTLRGKNSGLYHVPLIRKKTKKSSKDYKNAVMDAQEIIAMFDIIVDQVK